MFIGPQLQPRSPACWSEAINLHFSSLINQKKRSEPLKRDSYVTKKSTFFFFVCFIHTHLFGLISNEPLFILTLMDFVSINVHLLIGWTKKRVMKSCLCPQLSLPRPLPAGQAEEVGQRLIESGSLWPLPLMALGPVRFDVKLFHSNNHFHSGIISQSKDLTTFWPQWSVWCHFL